MTRQETKKALGEEAALEGGHGLVEDDAQVRRLVALAEDADDGHALSGLVVDMLMDEAERINNTSGPREQIEFLIKAGMEPEDIQEALLG
jgi:hypothetical protein